jgi:spore coat polysaccharide biosynthesis protein SpsF
VTFTRPGIVTQARTTSTRLPRKVLTEVAGRTLLDHHLDRLGATGLPVVVATTTNTGDDEIVSLCSARGVPVFRGSEDDVLGRFHGAVTQEGYDVVVRVTSDCPLVDGGLVASAVERFLAEGDPWVYLSNTQPHTYHRGLDLEVFSAEALDDADRHATEPFEREHVTPYLNRNVSGRMRIENVAADEDASDLRITVDTEDDLALVRALVEEHGAASLGWRELVRLLRAHPELVALNAHVHQKKLGE